MALHARCRRRRRAAVVAAALCSSESAVHPQYKASSLSSVPCTPRPRTPPTATQRSAELAGERLRHRRSSAPWRRRPSRAGSARAGPRLSARAGTPPLPSPPRRPAGGVLRPARAGRAGGRSPSALAAPRRLPPSSTPRRSVPWAAASSARAPSSVPRGWNRLRRRGSPRVVRAAALRGGVEPALGALRRRPSRLRPPPSARAVPPPRNQSPPPSRHPRHCHGLGSSRALQALVEFRPALPGAAAPRAVLTTMVDSRP